MTNVQVVTQSGQIVTQTITTTPSIPANSNQGARKTGIAPGYIAAAVIAGLLGLVFLLAGIWLFMRRKENRDGEKGFQAGSSRDMQRNVSVHSKAGLLANRNNVPAINTRFSGQPLMMDDGVTPVSPMSERRKSQPLIWDQRLNPNALMANENGSKTSLNTIDDHRDYGRTLQVRPRMSHAMIPILILHRSPIPTRRGPVFHDVHIGTFSVRGIAFPLMKQIMLMRRRLGFDDTICYGIAARAYRRISLNSMLGLGGMRVQWHLWHLPQLGLDLCMASSAALLRTRGG